MEKRRDFLKKTSLALASTALPISTLAMCTQKKKLGVALVGLGYYSTDLLAPALRNTEHCELKGIVTGSPEKIPIWQEKYGIKDSNVYNYENMHTMANNSDIDVVYIVTPNTLHEKHAVIGANAGKHVWCEKPMATTVKACKNIIEACKKNKVQLTIGYRLHHEPVTQQIMKWAANQHFGKAISVYAEAGFRSGGFNPNHWKLHKKLGGGAMYDMGVYPLNAVRYATGLEPIEVSARTKIYRTDKFTADEETTFQLKFPNDITASCKTSFAESINMMDYKAADGGYIVKPLQSYSGVALTTSNGKHIPAFNGSQQAKQMDDDALAILNKTNPMVPGEEGLKDIKVVEAIFKSAENNGKWFKV